MNSIEISINNIGREINIFINTKEHKAIINNQEKHINEEKIDELLRIIRTWDNIYENKSNTTDTESFLININTNEETYTIKGHGNYPKDYILFKEWIGELNG